MVDHSNKAGLDSALDWVARMQASDFADWEAHMDWLEADTAHPMLYQQAALAMSMGLSAFDRVQGRDVLPVASNVRQLVVGNRPSAGWWFPVGAAIAASIAVFAMTSPQAVEQDIVYKTAPGARRDVRLADGTSMALNGNTVLRMKHSAQRQIVLERGEAFLRVTRNVQEPFEIIAGGRIFRDVGTEFNISVDKETVNLTVAEGAVAVDPAGANVRIDAGKAMSIVGADASIGKVNPGNVGSWRYGRLVYANQSLPQVVSDLSRSLGVPIQVSPDLRHRRFTGVLHLGAAPDTVILRFSELAGVSGAETQSGWAISAGKGHRGQ
ncbi:MAG: hypothetical protein EOO77_07595 [Oxalobacteraceae bacterium]|nr:MAG: hypothetical protein EOO77_07595 [Oxalobacteraceae bacterium]